MFSGEINQLMHGGAVAPGLTQTYYRPQRAHYQYHATSPLIWFRPKRAIESDNANEQLPTKRQAQASLMQLWKK